MASDTPTPQRPGGTPSPIDPKEYPALAELQPHCRRGGYALIDRAYDDVLRLWKRCREAEDLAGLSTPPPPKPVYGGKLRENVIQHAAVIAHQQAAQGGEELL